MFGPLKAAYRDQVERLERGCVGTGCVGTIGKEHFTYLYSPARNQALTSRNIRAGWAKAGLFPFNPDKVLSDIPKPPAKLTAPKTNEVGSYTQDQVPQTPVTPVLAEAVASLHSLFKRDTNILDKTSKQRIQRHIQKLTNATQLSFTERALLQEQNRFLAEINNEAKARRSTKSQNLGEARVMSYEGLEKARVERAAKEAAKEAKKAEREAKKAEKETKKAAKEVEEVASAILEVEEATAGKEKLRRSKFNSAQESGRSRCVRARGQSCSDE